MASNIGSAFRSEIKAAFRAVTSQPAFSALVVAVLGVGLACMMFMLVMINAFAIRPLPFPSPDTLVHAGLASAHGGDGLDDLANRDIPHAAPSARGQTPDVAGVTQATVNLSDMDKPERFDGATVTANLWRVLGVAPVRRPRFLGRRRKTRRARSRDDLVGHVADALRRRILRSSAAKCASTPHPQRSSA